MQAILKEIPNRPVRQWDMRNRYERGPVEEVCQRRRTSEAQSIKAPSASSSVIPDELYEGYVFDLDGTIYLGDELLPGARRLVLALRELGKQTTMQHN